MYAPCLKHLSKLFLLQGSVSNIIKLIKLTLVTGLILFLAKICPNLLYKDKSQDCSDLTLSFCCFSYLHHTLTTVLIWPPDWSTLIGRYCRDHALIGRGLHSVATPALLCHKQPAQGTQKPLLGFSCLLLVLYGRRAPIIHPLSAHITA